MTYVTAPLNPSEAAMPTFLYPAMTATAIAARWSDTGDMVSSAKSCLADADAAIARGSDGVAARWAIRSLTYSVGVFHPAYREAVTVVADLLDPVLDRQALSVLS